MSCRHLWSKFMPTTPDACPCFIQMWKQICLCSIESPVLLQLWVNIVTVCL